MKICWVGWIGPCMLEASIGLKHYDPDMLYYVIGKNWSIPDAQVIKTLGNVKKFSTREQLFEDLKEFDVIFYDTYIFSHDDDPIRITSFLPGNGCVTQWPEWGQLPAIKVLFDGESVAGKREWYDNHLKYFDKCVTVNPDFPGLLVYFGADPEIYCSSTRICAATRGVKCLFSGDNLGVGYRKQLADLLNADKENLCLAERVSEKEWVELLSNSKMYLATYSCASGARDPMCIKPKDARALLCGALPLTEEYAPADRFLTPGVERVTFKDFDDLKNKIEYYSTHEEERLAIVAAGIARVMRDLTNEKMWRNVMNYLEEEVYG